MTEWITSKFLKNAGTRLGRLAAGGVAGWLNREWVTRAIEWCAVHGLHVTITVDQVALAGALSTGGAWAFEQGWKLVKFHKNPMTTGGPIAAVEKKIAPKK